MKELEHYVAFRRLKNFVCVKLRPKDLLVWARLDPLTVVLEEGFTRDVSKLGHAGTGDLEIRLQTAGRSVTRPATAAAQLSRGLIRQLQKRFRCLFRQQSPRVFKQPLTRRRPKSITSNSPQIAAWA
jgi:predicted transport protein